MTKKTRKHRKDMRALNAGLNKGMAYVNAKKRKEDQYLNSLIDKATPKWKDVDPDKFLEQFR